MTKEEEKETLCNQHRVLLFLILRFGNGAILLAQLRALCLALGLYSSGQMVNRIIRSMRDMAILDRQTWVDNNSDLIIARKYLYRYFNGQTSQQAATPPRPKTMGPYILQARKIDLLLHIIGSQGLTTLEQVEQYLARHACTIFLRLPDLLGYYQRYKSLLSDNPLEYRAQLDKLAESADQRQRMARHLPPRPVAPDPCGVPVITLEQMHRRNIHILDIAPTNQEITLIMWADRGTTARRILDWTIDAIWWVRSLLPGYAVRAVIQALDDGHKAALTAALTARRNPTAPTYWKERLTTQRLDGTLLLSVHDSDFINHWCGGIRTV